VLVLADDSISFSVPFGRTETAIALLTIDFTPKPASQNRGLGSSRKNMKASLSRKIERSISKTSQGSNGTITIVEIKGETYLVDLDGQAAKLWEKAWGLKKV
jgi:urease alpha subunit